MKVALITGITGQDGSYLAELLLEKGYEVHGIVRRASLINSSWHRIDHIYDQLQLHYGDLTDSTNLVRVIQQVQPDEIYNLGAQSHVKVSFEMPEYTGQTDALGTLRVLEAVRLLGMEDRVRIYQASTSELYGLVQESSTKRDHTISIHVLLMVLQNCMDIGSSRTIVKHMECIVVLVSSLITNHHGGVRRL